MRGSTQALVAIEACHKEAGQLTIHYEVLDRDGQKVGSHDGGLTRNPWHIALAPMGGDANRLYSVKVVLKRGDGTNWASVSFKGGYEAGQVVTWHIALSEGANCICEREMCTTHGGCRVMKKYGRVTEGDSLCTTDGGMMMDTPIVVMEAGGLDVGLDGGMVDASCERCGGTECVDLMSDLQNCGRCGMRCEGGGRCIGGSCRSVRGLALGGGHSCAWLSDGSARCWGENEHGQLGDGTMTDRATPVQVMGLRSEVEAIAAGYEHTCA
ncbi:MAG: hypothetical protein RMJ84_11600, partial [Sandaracinaceae bacterium]|nr:hypothetical protein [Sandaracinaceae bacterium]